MLILVYGFVEVSLITGKLDMLSFKLATLLTWRNDILLITESGAHQSSVACCSNCEAQNWRVAPLGHLKASELRWVFVAAWGIFTVLYEVFARGSGSLVVASGLVAPQHAGS